VIANLDNLTIAIPTHFLGVTLNKINNMSDTNPVIVYALLAGQTNDNPIDYNAKWGKKHWMDSNEAN